MNCRSARRMLSERQDGRLTPGQSKTLDEHLAHCSECTDEARRFERLAGLLPQWPVAPVPASLKERVLERAKTPAEPRSVRRADWLRWAAAAAVLAVVVGAVIRLNARRGASDEEVARVPEDKETTLYVAPELPPEMAELCRKLSPAAARAVANASESVATLVTDASGQLAAATKGIPPHVEDFVYRHVSVVMKAGDGMLRIFAPSKKEPRGESSDRSFPPQPRGGLTCRIVEGLSGHAMRGRVRVAVVRRVFHAEARRV